MVKRHLVVLYVVVFLAVVPGAIMVLQYFRNQEYHPYGASPSCEGCNVILITLDALRADHLGVYGYSKNTSPVLDEFAEESFVFGNSISQCGFTFCSFPSMFTSRFPYSDRLGNGSQVIAEGQTTISEYLKARGYETYAVAGVEHIKSGYGLSQGFGIYDESYAEMSRAHIISEKAVGMLENSSEPFFLWVHFREPHYPYLPPARLFNLMCPNSTDWVKSYDGLEEYFYESDEQGNVSVIDAVYDEVFSAHGLNEREYTFVGQKKNLSLDSIEWLRCGYDANIGFVDEQVGLLLGYIDESGMSNNTIIVVTADHGESLGEHGIFDHNDLYQGIIHVPLMVRLPGGKGGRYDYPVSSADIVPTIMDLLKFNVSSGFRGRNLFDSDREDYFQFSEVGHKCAVIKDGWKLISWFNPLRDELYDIEKDVNETRNLVWSHPVTYAKLKLRAIGIKLDYRKRDSPGVYQDEETKEKLRNLGYAV